MSVVVAANLWSKTAWSVVPLSRVCTFKPPKSICRGQLADNAEVSFVPMNDLGELAKYFEPKDARPFGEVVKSYTYFADGDVLCAKITPCFENGKLGVARGMKNGVGFGSSEFVVMRPSVKLLPEFLYYFLSRDAFREIGVRLMSGAVGHKRVPNEYFEALPIPLPPLEEQKRIVAVLDRAFAALDRARANAEANLADAQELFDAKLNNVFSAPHSDWERSPLCVLCSKIGSGATPKGGAASYGTTGISLVRSLNVHDRRFISEKLAYIGEVQAKKLSNVALESGDVLFNITGASIARCCIVPDAVLPARVNQHVSILRPDPSRLLSEFLCFMLTCTTQKKRLLQVGMEGGSTRQAITKAELERLVVMFPQEVVVQKRIIEQLKSAEMKSVCLKSAYRKRLKDLVDLRQSLLQKAFAGQLA